MHEESPTVYHLPVHLKDQQMVFFNPDNEAEDVANCALNKDTQLIAFQGEPVHSRGKQLPLSRLSSEDGMEGERKEVGCTTMRFCNRMHDFCSSFFWRMFLPSHPTNYYKRCKVLGGSQDIQRSPLPNLQGCLSGTIITRSTYVIIYVLVLGL
jgi:hypothetical protein